MGSELACPLPLRGSFSVRSEQGLLLGRVLGLGLLVHSGQTT
jgi:hypothetical protein